ncbi:hypothetical protein MAPG_02908 [Magnaporthiopsis poae ATCC 64411]|uniref:Uncharacterized protein n=1 Tax=Magnaporthiopsis poae (strain ATCC 64411 / 73-15) TaxID=644358 RepID=A0A0C4DSM6_MAGP6|nr:hypothetical protein MAPG_02908 [Magnaporthiopsis poae ATCC 64411]
MALRFARAHAMGVSAPIASAWRGRGSLPGCIAPFIARVIVFESPPPPVGYGAELGRPGGRRSVGGPFTGLQEGDAACQLCHPYQNSPISTPFSRGFEILSHRFTRYANLPGIGAAGTIAQQLGNIQQMLKTMQQNMAAGLEARLVQQPAPELPWWQRLQPPTPLSLESKKWPTGLVLRRISARWLAAARLAQCPRDRYPAESRPEA